MKQQESGQAGCIIACKCKTALLASECSQTDDCKLLELSSHLSERPSLFTDSKQSCRSRSLLKLGGHKPYWQGRT